LGIGRVLVDTIAQWLGFYADRYMLLAGAKLVFGGRFTGAGCRRSPACFRCRWGLPGIAAMACGGDHC